MENRSRQPLLPDELYSEVSLFFPARMILQYDVDNKPVRVLPLFVDFTEVPIGRSTARSQVPRWQL
jgi:hypothetical protein